ncbi:N-6 DNA methylase [uncultured Desulfosarcina sp.]|uniref:HsdM family class I SAM-dependent methyltransferase n=1 Tax=uncultured Desulfosarcina sp. TaxID=218289 RepID=UPI0029C73B3B|nr:N-6 DNA methylase [uncultured Desulfosarcina sp.]
MNIVNTVKAFGCHDVVLLDDEPNPRHLDYLDLLKISGKERLKVDAVAEFQSRPLLYIVSADQKRAFGEKNVLDLQCLLANRGERAYLSVLSPGELHVFPINLDRSILANSRKTTIKKESSKAPFFFQSIVNGIFTMEGQPEEPDYVFGTINDLMTRSSKLLIKTYELNQLDVLSFLGRALFFRFLWDRKIIRSTELTSVCPQAKSPGDCFSNIINSVATCRWLDETFNGDMLPLSGDYNSVFSQADKQTAGKLFFHMRAIIEGWKHAGNEAFQQLIDWGDLDFAHIPIGVLSQVYENFSKIWDLQQREQTSAYYTPKNIARYLVDDAFEGVTEKKDARILDPSCGAGIFLVLAFRKLVAARWENDKKRPDTKTIQSILYNQLSGFDVSESALRLAALSLYITAIELNGTPRPPKSLKFPEPLQGKVLYNHRRVEEQSTRGFVLGSLRPDLPQNFDGRFDMIIGNPPWSRLKGDDEKTRREIKAQNVIFTNLTRQILIDRGLEDMAKTYRNPDNNPDLPFLWKSIQWAKPGGIIAMALPGRIFLKQTASGTRTFNTILKGIEVTGILNGSNLSDSLAVWPGMNQPFMLFFARNQVPADNHHFHFVTPHFEKHLNDKGRIRIDYQSAQPIAVSDVIKNSRLLKTLSVGTALDVEIVHKVDDLNWPTVKKYWKSQGLYSGLGYNRSPKLRQYDASFICGLPDFIPPANDAFLVDISSLPKFKDSEAHMPRRIELYTPPLLIVPESPGSSLTSPKSWIVREPTVFRKSYYGFSAHGCKDAAGIIAMLHLITHTDLFRYHVLMTSSRMGAERRTFLKENIENFPFPAKALLTKQQRQKTMKLSSQLETAANKPWKEINDFIFNLYGLDQYDRQVIEDTLKVATPFKDSRNRANAPPIKAERNVFYIGLQRLLQPSFEVTHETVSIDEIDISEQDFRSPWHFFTVSSSSILQSLTQTEQKKLISKIAEEANKTGCSRVIVHEKEHLLVGIIGQYRYWTLSRARLCASQILRHHLDTFPIGRS